MQGSGTAAKRYATAFFGYAQEGGNLEGLAADLEALATLIADCPDFAAFVANPVIADTKRDAILDTLLAKADAVTKRAIRFLIHRDRLALLPGICAEFQALHDEQKGIRRIQIVAATELESSQVDAIAQRIAQKYDGATIKPTLRIDESLLGGFIVIAGDQVYDCSIRSQLERLKKQIVNA